MNNKKFINFYKKYKLWEGSNDSIKSILKFSIVKKYGNVFYLKIT